MIRSMTGYGQASAELPGCRLSVELRSLNRRFAEASLRLPSELAHMESGIRRRLLERVRRGRVELWVKVEPTAGDDGGSVLNRPLLEQVLAACRILREEFAVGGVLEVNSLLAVPGMFAGTAAEVRWGEQETAVLDQALEAALDALETERKREGRRLQEDLEQRLAAMSSVVDSMRRRAAELPATLRERLLARLAALAPGIALDPGRVAQEAAILADRSDVTEEIVRLDAHLEQVRVLLGGTVATPLGKELDFLLQEVHRECNTVGSKSADLELGRHVLALKAEAERVREQVQNLE